jgi:phage recombination protein Bet
MQKPVHIVPMYDKASNGMRDVIMPGVGLYRTTAARTGEMAGITEPEFGEDIVEEFPSERKKDDNGQWIDVPAVTITYPKWCKVTVSRLLKNGQIVSFTAKELWKENYATSGKYSHQPNSMWRKRPYAQLAKCAEAQALRKAFPEVGAAPTADEMEGKAIDITESATHIVHDKPVQPKAPTPY